MGNNDIKLEYEDVINAGLTLIQFWLILVRTMIIT